MGGGEKLSSWRTLIRNISSHSKSELSPPNRKILYESTTQDFSTPSNLRFFVFDHHYLWNVFDDPSSVIMIKKKLNTVSLIKKKFSPFSYSSQIRQSEVDFRNEYNRYLVIIRQESADSSRRNRLDMDKGQCRTDLWKFRQNQRIDCKDIYPWTDKVSFNFYILRKTNKTISSKYPDIKEK